MKKRIQELQETIIEDLVDSDFNPHIQNAWAYVTGTMVVPNSIKSRTAALFIRDLKKVNWTQVEETLKEIKAAPVPEPIAAAWHVKIPDMAIPGGKKVIVDTAGRRIATVDVDDGDWSNAHLIAHAPTMKALLENIDAITEDDGMDPDSMITEIQGMVEPYAEKGKLPTGRFQSKL